MAGEITKQSSIETPGKLQNAVQNGEPSINSAASQNNLPQNAPLQNDEVLRLLSSKVSNVNLVKDDELQKPAAKIADFYKQILETQPIPENVSDKLTVKVELKISRPAAQVTLE